MGASKKYESQPGIALINVYYFLGEGKREVALSIILSVYCIYPPIFV